MEVGQLGRHVVRLKPRDAHLSTWTKIKLRWIKETRKSRRRLGYIVTKFLGRKEPQKVPFILQTRDQTVGFLFHLGWNEHFLVSPAVPIARAVTDCLHRADALTGSCIRFHGHGESFKD